MEIFKNELELIKDEKLRAFTDFISAIASLPISGRLALPLLESTIPLLVREMVDWFGTLKRLCIFVMSL